MNHEPAKPNPPNVCPRCGGTGADPEPSGVCHCGDSADHGAFDAGHVTSALQRR